MNDLPPENPSPPAPPASDGLLVPATYDPEEGVGAFTPERRWLVILGILLGIVGFFAVQIVARVRAEARFREELAARYERDVAEHAAELSAYLDRLNGWIAEAAASGEAEALPTSAAEGFRWSEMHDRRGLYLRVEAEYASDPEQLALAARAMQRDAITRCLGVTPVSVRGLYDLAAYFSPEWPDRVRAEEDHMTLRVMEDELTRRLATELPLAERMMRADYLLLLVTRGGRAEGTVDAFAIDLETGERLMTTRTQADGRLLNVRLEGSRIAWPSEEDLSRSGATDCSIAAALKAAGGEEVGMPRRRPEAAEDAETSS